MAMTAATAPLPFPVLIGDIGGTNARFALIEDPGTQRTTFKTVATNDFPDIETAIAESVFAQTPSRPRSAVIDLAGPIVGDAVDLTNAPWIVRPPDMIAKNGVKDVILLNDFEALAMALPSLAADDLVSVGPAMEPQQGAKLVLGPGTGLGVGGLVRAEDVWVPVPGEGGHVELGPAERDEFPIWAHIEPEMGRISGEALLAGRGIVRLYRAVARTEGHEPVFTRPSDVTEAALSGKDQIAIDTLSLYCRLLGRLAGDMALVFMARGGVYLGGGIAPRILPFLLKSPFRQAFEAKAPHAEVMAAIPSWVIVAKNPALQGLAAFARAPERFGVNLSGRRWLK